MYNKSILLTTELYDENRFESALAGVIRIPTRSQSDGRQTIYENIMSMWFIVPWIIRHHSYWEVTRSTMLSHTVVRRV